MKYIWALLAVLYIIYPRDLISDGLGIWGRLDDLIVLYFLIRYWIRKVKHQTASRTHYEQQSGNQRRDQGSSSGSTGSASGTSNDPYSILGVGPNATQEEIQQAYRKLANQYHPDKVSHLGKEFAELSEKRFKEIQNAYQTLKKDK
jgi:DnaJ-domain-containing protein 1